MAEGKAVTEADLAAAKKPGETKPDETVSTEAIPASQVESAAPTESAHYILPESSNQYLAELDLSGMDAWQLKLARNEIYARYGRMFKNQDIQHYFNQQTWYKGTIAPDDFSESTLSEIEKANIALIK